MLTVGEAEHEQQGADYNDQRGNTRHAPLHSQPQLVFRQYGEPRVHGRHRGGVGGGNEARRCALTPLSQPCVTGGETYGRSQAGTDADYQRLSWRQDFREFQARK